MRLLAGTQIWERITPLLRDRDDIFAALAHIGSNADSLLPLRAGATIITDASESSIREGATDPEVLLAWVRRGVKVFSLPGLNAKVILAEGTPALAVIGSADPSWSSAHTYYEAGIITEDADSVAELRITLVAWLNQTSPRAPLTQEWLAQAIDFYGSDLLGDSGDDSVGTGSVGVDSVGTPASGSVGAPASDSIGNPAPTAAIAPTAAGAPAAVVAPVLAIPSAVAPTPAAPSVVAPPAMATAIARPAVAAPTVAASPAAAPTVAAHPPAPSPVATPPAASPVATPPVGAAPAAPEPRLDEATPQQEFNPTESAVEAVAAISPFRDTVSALGAPEPVAAEPLPPFETEWKRPAGIYLSPMDSAGQPSAGAMEILEELHEEEGLPFDVDERGNSRGDNDFSLTMFWWDETGDFTEKWKFPKGRFVVPLQTMGRRMGVTAKASPPGLVRHCYTDHSANPPRTYYYVLVRNSSVRSVTFKDVQQNFAAIGAKPEFDSCFWVQTKIDALLNLWPDIQYDD